MSAGLKYMTAAIDNGAGNAVLRLEADLLLDEREVQVYDFIRNFYREYRECPTIALVQENTGVRLPRADGPLSFHEDNLHERFQFQIIRDGYQDLREQIQGGVPGPLIQTLEGMVRRVRRTRRNQGLVNIADAMGQSIARLESLQNSGGMSGVPTPWPTFNFITSGYQKADLITWVGRTSLGKTMTLLYQAEYAYDAGYSVLFVTTEMGSEQIARRWMGMRFGLDSEALKKAQVSTRLLRRMREMQAELLGRERFRILSVGMGADFGAVEAALDEVQPDILYLDGVYLLKPSGKGFFKSKTEQVSQVFDELKASNISADIPFVVNTQFNRSAGKGGKEGSLETIGLSDTIGQHSSIVVAVKPGPTEDWRRSRELDLLKGREGEEGSVIINYSFKPTNLSEMTQEEREALGDGGGPQIGADGEIYN